MVYRSIFFFANLSRWFIVTHWGPLGLRFCFRRTTHARCRALKSAGPQQVVRQTDRKDIDSSFVDSLSNAPRQKSRAVTMTASTSANYARCTRKKNALPPYPSARKLNVSASSSSSGFLEPMSLPTLNINPTAPG